MGVSLKILTDVLYTPVLIAQIPFFLIEVKGIYRPGAQRENFFTKTVNFVLTRFTANCLQVLFLHKLKEKITGNDHYYFGKKKEHYNASFDEQKRR